jgi:hypothetical protein
MDEGMDWSCLLVAKDILPSAQKVALWIDVVVSGCQDLGMGYYKYIPTKRRVEQA